VTFAPADGWTIAAFSLGAAAILLALTGRASSTGLALAAFLLLVAASRPRWGPPPAFEPLAPGADLWIVVDVSRSMLTRDVGASRLERAKEIARAWIDRDPADRVAVVAFAGGASLVSPPTGDRTFVRDAIDDLGIDSAPPGGSRLDAALLRIPLSSLPGGSRVLVLSDGGHQDDGWVGVGEAVAAAGLRLTAVGIGDPDEAHPIPLDGGFLRRGENLVRTRLNEKSLRRLAAESRGVYIPARTGMVDLPAVGNVPRGATSAGRGAGWTRGTQWLAAAAALALAAASLRRRATANDR
jgi:Ca-activated chloride channel family protein